MLYKIKHAVGSLRIDGSVSKSAEDNIKRILLDGECSKTLKKKVLDKYRQP